jgi:hypothetical protein
MHIETALVPALLLSLTFAALAQPPDAVTNDDRIRPWDDLPRFWQYKGEPVLLIGGSDEDNLFNDPALMAANLGALAECGGNYIRGTLSWRDENNVPPYVAGDDGQYDLERLNPEFFQRLEDCCRECYERDIIIQIEVWATFDYYRDQWLANPWNPANNVNYTAEESGLPTEWPHHPAANPQPFFYSPPELNDNELVREYQEAFVRKVLEVTLPYPNILYCMDNETKTPPQWAWYWAEFIRAEADRQGVPVQLTEMWDDWNILAERHSHTYSRPDLFDFVDVSQNNWMDWGDHYPPLLEYRAMLADSPMGIRPMNNVKVYGKPVPGQELDPALNVDRFWQNIWAGCASTRFHRPDSGLGCSELAQTSIRAARAITDAFDVFAAEPRPDLLSGHEGSGAYLLCVEGEAYAVYLTAGGTVTVDVSAMDGQAEVRWLDVETAELGQSAAIEGDAATLTSPGTEGPWCALVTAR